MIVKASRITNLTDARYFAAREVQFLGFNLEPDTPGYLDPMYMKAIREWVQGPKITGEFTATPLETVREAALFYGLDAVQIAAQSLPNIHILEDIPTLVRLQASDAPAQHLHTLRAAKGLYEYLILDFSGTPDIDPAIWRDFFAEFPVLLDAAAFPDADTLGRYIHLLQPAGIALSGGEEEQVGVKSFDEMEEILDRVGA